MRGLLLGALFLILGAVGTWMLASVLEMRATATVDDPSGVATTTTEKTHWMF